MPNRILVAIDGSDIANRALAFASEISAKIGGDLTILHVLMHGEAREELEHLAVSEHLIAKSTDEAPPNPINLPRSITDILAQPDGDKARAVSEIGDYIVECARVVAQEAGARNIRTRIESGDYADEILKVASDIDADLLVLGRRGLSRVRSLLFGSVSNKVVQNAECDITAVR